MTIFEIYQQFQLTSGFGPRTYKDEHGNWVSDVHWGADFATPIGTPIHSHGDYRLKLSGNYSGEYILNMEALDGSHNWTIGHGSGCPLKPGAVVKAGDLVFYTGNSGNSTGPHDHTEYDQGKFKGSVTANHNAGTTVDPTPYIQAIGGINVTEVENFSNCYITQAQRWPTDQEVSDWQATGQPAYEWVQAHAPNPVLWDSTFADSYITQAGQWPPNSEFEAYRSSEFYPDRPYAWVQQFALNPKVSQLEQELDQNEVIIDELHQELEDCEAQHGCDCGDSEAPQMPITPTDPSTPTQPTADAGTPSPAAPGLL